jgi:hypothetical protein
MVDGHKTRFSRYAGAIMVSVFAIVCVTSSICPACLSEDLVSAQQTAAHNVDHHHTTHDCDGDGCSCCGFQFLIASHQSIVKASEFTPALARLIEHAPTDYPSDFYHPPRA